MPTLKIVPRGTSLTQPVPQDIVDQYKELIQQGDEASDNLLEFGPKEDVRLGKKALKLAADQLGRKLRIMKARGADNVVRFTFLSDEEDAERQRKALARGAKIQATRRKRTK
jgi:hypothetical protein